MKEHLFKLCIITVLISVFIVPFNILAFAESSNNWQDKLSAELKQKFDNADKDDLIPVYIWTKDIDHEKIEEEVEEETGLTSTNIQETYDNIDSEIFTSSEEKSSEMLKQNSKDTKEKRQKQQEKVNKYREKKRELSKKEYVENNTNLAGKISIANENIIYSTQYSPMVIANLSVQQIKKAAKMYSIESIDFYEEKELIPQTNDSAVQSIQADYTRDTLGFDGTGVKVGMLDHKWPAINYGALEGKITYVGPGEVDYNNNDPHSQNVARLILEPAPGCHIYAADCTTGETFCQSLERLIDCGVSVINMCVSFEVNANNTNWYDSFERWVDHIAGVHEVSFVCAASNYGTTHANIPSPGRAYNVITVGAINDNGTGSNYSDDFLEPSSSYNNGGTAGCAKPDVMAPGNCFLDCATSYATPLVTGIIAQMMECRPGIAFNTRLVKAVLLAGCDRKVPGESMGYFTAIQGAGVVNAKKSITILTSNRYCAFHIEPNVGFTKKTININTGNNVASVAYTWVRTNSVSGSHATATPNTAPYIDVTMRVFAPNGSLQGTSAIPRSSVELLQFNPTSYGNYTIRINRLSDLDYKVWGGLAWY